MERKYAAWCLLISLWTLKTCHGDRIPGVCTDITNLPSARKLLDVTSQCCRRRRRGCCHCCCYSSSPPPSFCVVSKNCDLDFPCQFGDWFVYWIGLQPGWPVGKSAVLVIERLQVRILAGAAGEFTSSELTLCADSHSVSVPPPCYRSGT